jgi:hypothetical protein
MNVSKTEGALEAVGVWAPPFLLRFYFSVGVSPLIQKAVLREENLSLKSQDCVGVNFSVGASPSGPDSFLNLWEINSMTDSFKNKMIQNESTM